MPRTNCCGAVYGYLGGLKDTWATLHLHFLGNTDCTGKDREFATVAQKPFRLVVICPSTLSLAGGRFAKWSASSEKPG